MKLFWPFRLGPRPLKYKLLLIIILFIVLYQNISFIFSPKDDLYLGNLYADSFSPGLAQFGRFLLSRQLIKVGKYSQALAIYPPLGQSIQKRLETLKVKRPKSTDDWLEVASLFTLLNQPENASLAISAARQSDPIRQDLERLYYSIKPTP